MTTTTTSERERLWTVHDVGEYLGVPPETLYTWRKRRYGPAGRRVGRHLRYDPEAVRQWFRDLEPERR
ncbi:helix-turn-helix transcriptional regulator [Dactylosporangium sucinum]|uniref:Helix-turn-helix domain-containing protein n=1 Tax=Dactylosporangium sucinum TaxID=1424081 RepID=A0A917U8S1_9ACTN|nr:helix-turn-helix domain-containing protein [Dactylosporangium sucinum]GGM60807.1 helix-turn-helix domain-containing protein [Dactylosporangium sucinum]